MPPPPPPSIILLLLLLLLPTFCFKQPCLPTALIAFACRTGAHVLATLRGRCLRGTTVPAFAATIKHSSPSGIGGEGGKWEVVSKGEPVRNCAAAAVAPAQSPPGLLLESRFSSYVHRRCGKARKVQGAVRYGMCQCSEMAHAHQTVNISHLCVLPHLSALTSSLDFQIFDCRLCPPRRRRPAPCGCHNLCSHLTLAAPPLINCHRRHRSIFAVESNRYTFEAPVIAAASLPLLLLCSSFSFPTALQPSPPKGSVVAISY